MLPRRIGGGGRAGRASVGRVDIANVARRDASSLGLSSLPAAVAQWARSFLASPPKIPSANSPNQRIIVARLIQLSPFGQYEWGSTFADALKNVFADHFVAVTVGDQFAIEILKLNSLIGIGFQHRTKCCWPHDHRMLKRAGE